MGELHARPSPPTGYSLRRKKGARCIFAYSCFTVDASRSKGTYTGNIPLSIGPKVFLAHSCWSILDLGTWLGNMSWGGFERRMLCYTCLLQWQVQTEGESEGSRTLNLDAAPPLAFFCVWGAWFLSFWGFGNASHIDSLVSSRPNFSLAFMRPAHSVTHNDTTSPLSLGRFLY
jgi:hypothetical protein